MINPKKPLQLARLIKAIDWSEEQLRRYRIRRTELIRQQVGRWWGADGAAFPVPLGMLRQAKQTYGRQLAARTPRVLVTTEYVTLRHTAAVAQAAYNVLLKEMRFHIPLAEVVDDALDSVGIAKIGIERGGNADAQGWLHDPETPFFDRVSLDDFVPDMSVTRWDKCRFKRDKYWVTRADLESMPHFRRKAVGDVQMGERSAYGETGEDRAQAIGLDYLDNESDVEPMVELQDIYLDREGLVLTVPTAQPTLLLAVWEWDGPEAGPYAVLGFGSVADNLMPFSPLEMIYDLHMLANALYRKLSDQAVGQKTIGIGPKGSVEENTAVQEAKDGDFLQLTNAVAANIQQLKLGGVDGGNAAFAIETLRRLDMMAGNLSLMAGLGPQSETATQDQLLMENASMFLAEMMDATVAYATDCIERLGWYWWHHPTLRVDTMLGIQGTGESVPVSFTREMRREGDFAEHNFEIEPYSLRHMTPQQHLKAMVEFLDRLLPVLPYMQQEGASMDWQRFVDMYADYSNTPQIRELLTFSEPAAPEVGQVGPVPPKAAHTVRETVRTNRPGHTQSGQDTAMAQAFSGKPPQDSELAGIFQ